jgi:translation initiation factor IF-3
MLKEKKNKQHKSIQKKIEIKRIRVKIKIKNKLMDCNKFLI